MHRFKRSDIAAKQPEGLGCKAFSVLNSLQYSSTKDGFLEKIILCCVLSVVSHIFIFGEFLSVLNRVFILNVYAIEG